MRSFFLVTLVITACSPPDVDGAGGGTTAGGFTAGGFTAGGPTAGGATAGGSTAGGSTAGGSTAGGSTAGGSTAGGSTAGGSTAGGSTAGGSTAGGSTAGGSTAGGSTAGGVSGGSAGMGDGGVDPACSRGWCALSPLPFGSGGMAVASNGTTVAMGNAVGVVWRLQNGRWERITTDGLGQLLSLRVFGPNDIWATGRSRLIAHFDGTGWTTIAPPADMELGAAVWGVWGPDAQTVWFTAATASVTTSPKIWRWTAAGFTAFSTGTSTAGFYGVWGSAANSIYFVGPYSQVVRFNGVGISPVTVPSGDYFAIDGSGPNDIHVVGNNGAIRWNGTTWSTTSTQTGLNDVVVMPSPTREAWAVGTGGKTLYWDGQAWTLGPVVTTRSLFEVASQGMEAWAVGADSEFLHLSGLQWTSRRTAPMPPATALVSGQDSTFLISDGGVVFQRMGNAFTQRPERNLAFPSAASTDALWTIDNSGISKGTDAGFVRVATCPSTSCQNLRPAYGGRFTFTTDNWSLYEFVVADAGVRSMNYSSFSVSTAALPAQHVLIAVERDVANLPTRYTTFGTDGGSWVARTVVSAPRPASASNAFVVPGEGVLYNTFSAAPPYSYISAVWVSLDGTVNTAFPTINDLQSVYSSLVPFNANTVFLLRRTTTPTLSLVLPDAGVRTESVPDPHWISCEPNRTCTAITTTGAVYARD